MPRRIGPVESVAFTSLFVAVATSAVIAAIATAGGTPGALVEYAVRYDGSGRVQMGGDGPVMSPYPARRVYDLATLSRSADGRWFSYNDQGTLYLGDTNPLSANSAPHVTPRAIYVPQLPPPETPRFSPGGGRIAFTASPHGEGSPNGIYVVANNGSGLRQIVPNGRDPSWSSDGKWLSYTRGNLGRRSVYVVALNGNPPRRIAHGHEALFSPKGKRLAYVAGNTTVAIVNRDGSGRRFIGKVGAGPANLVWSSDGQHLSWRGSSGLEIALAADGWKPHLVRACCSAVPLSFSPSGSRIAYASNAIYTVPTTGRGKPSLLTKDWLSYNDVRWTSDTELTYLTVAH